MKLSVLGSLALLSALIACSPGGATTSATTTTSVSTTSSGAAAAQRIHLGPAVLIGAWSFDNTCASGDGMVLQPNGTVSMGEDQQGLWGIDGDGALVVLTQQVEPGDLEHHASGGPATHYMFEMREPDQDHLYSADHRAQPITAKRCPSDQAPPPND